MDPIEGLDNVSNNSKTSKKSGGVLDKIYNNYKWIFFGIVTIVAVILVILSFVEFGKDDENEKPIKIIFGLVFSISVVLLLSITGIYFYKNSQYKSSKNE